MERLLALVCTAEGFILLAALIADIGPVRATTVTYVKSRHRARRGRGGAR